MQIQGNKSIKWILIPPLFFIIHTRVHCECSTLVIMVTDYYLAHWNGDQTNKPVIFCLHSASKCIEVWSKLKGKENLPFWHPSLLLDREDPSGAGLELGFPEPPTLPETSCVPQIWPKSQREPRPSPPCFHTPAVGQGSRQRTKDPGVWNYVFHLEFWFSCS
jgi:hypothetical protein